MTSPGLGATCHVLPGFLFLSLTSRWMSKTLRAEMAREGARRRSWTTRLFGKGLGCFPSALTRLRFAKLVIILLKARPSRPSPERGEWGPPTKQVTGWPRLGESSRFIPSRGYICSPRVIRSKLGSLPLPLNYRDMGSTMQARCPWATIFIVRREMCGRERGLSALGNPRVVPGGGFFGG